MTAAAVLALTAGAWALTGQRMAGMDAGPGSALGSLGWFSVSWTVMMAAMMLPALAPMVVAYGRRSERPGATPTFVTGYLAVWLAVGLAGYAAIAAVRSLGIGFIAWSEAGRYMAAGVILGAGIYQLTAWKDAWLQRCRERQAFLQQHSRAGRHGALRTGVEHGGCCVGCSWALMASLFALGVMSLTWMALVAGLIAAERMLPRTARLAVALVLVMLGTAVALVPSDVPALTVPRSSGMAAMRIS